MKHTDKNPKLLRKLLVFVTSLFFGTLLIFSESALGIELTKSALPFGGASLSYFVEQDSTVDSDSVLFLAATDSGGVWIHYDSLDREGRLHYYLIDSIYTILDGMLDSIDRIPSSDEYMELALDSSDLSSGKLVYYGESPLQYVDTFGIIFNENIPTRARLTFRTIAGDSVALVDSVEELTYQPALQVRGNFRVNVAIEAQVPANTAVDTAGVWLPAFRLARGLTSLPDSLVDSLFTRPHAGFNPNFFYDTTLPDEIGIKVTPISPTSMEICWDPPSKNTDSVVLEFRVADSVDFVPLRSFLNDTAFTCFLHEELDSNGVYAYRVRAINGNGESPDSPTVLESTAGHTFTEVAGTTSGYTPVDAQVNESGGVTASVPLTIPAGTSGMQPQLSIAITHNSGEPVIGGLSAISRSAPTYAQDGIQLGILFNENDRFTLDGERLIAVQGNYGESGARYRTEQETFQDVVSEGSRVSGPGKFIVRTKDGLTKYYGDTEDSRIELGGDEDKIMYWLLNKVEDVFGNYYTVSYTEDTENGYFYPFKIDYTGNDGENLSPYSQVLFEYEDRPDVFNKFVLGDSSKRTQRLRSVKAYYKNQLARKYELSYTEIGFNKISKLGSVTEYGSDGSNFASTIFRWQDEDRDSENQFSSPELILASFNNGLKPYSTNGWRERFVDMNNDGLSDYVFFPEGQETLYVAFSNGTGLDEPVEWLSSGTYGKAYSTNAHHEHYADFNGDNYTDYAWVPAGGNSFWVALGNGGDKFETPTEWLAAGSAGNNNPFSLEGQHEFVLDFNGDGRSDYLFYPNGGEDWYLALSVGSGFENGDSQILIDKSDASGNSLISNKGQHETFIDINNDGYMDFLYRPNGVNDLWLIQASGDSQDPFRDAIKWLSQGDAEGSDVYSAEGRFESYADVNGDGLQDRIWKPSNKDKLFVALSNGSKSQAPEPWLDKSVIGLNVFSNNGTYQSFIDLNRDGLSDFMYVPSGSSGLYVAYSTGSSFAQPILLQASNVNSVNTTSSNNLHDRFGDINGDGVIDKVWLPSGRSDMYVSFLSAPNPLLQSATNGHGRKISYEYRTLTDSTVYERGSDAVYPLADFQAPIYVVSEQTTDDAVGGEYKIGYRYFNAQIELEGRGFRGYGKTENLDLETDRRTVVYFNRDFRHVGSKVIRSEEYAGGVKISEVENELAFGDTSPDVYRSFVKSSRQKSFELDGSVINDITTTYQYDIYGNAIYVEVDYGDGYKDVTENEYDNDESSWRLGRVIQTEVTRTAPGHSETRTTTFEYDTRTGILEKEILEPGNELSFEKEYIYNDFGNIIQNISRGSDEERIQTTEYDDEGRFILKTTNALGHSESTDHEMFYGQPAKITGPNGLSTYFEYDGFGRKTREILPDGNIVRYSRRRVQSSEVPNAIYFIQKDISGSPPEVIYYDLFDRVLRRQNVNFDGTIVFSDMEYDHRGNLSRQSDPYSQDAQWTTYEYDIINRLIKTENPGNRTSTVVYNGLTMVSTNPNGQTLTQTQDVIGQLAEVIDDEGSSLTYEYDAFGNVVSTTDPIGNKVLAEFDVHGNRIKLDDPDMGVYQYTYNAFGELITQTYPEGTSVNHQYDKLSRLIQRGEPEGITSWTYDEEFIGKVSTVEMDGYKKTINYDDYGRAVKETTNLGKEDLITSSNYDAQGRLQEIIYPSGLSVRNNYNEYGYLSEVRSDRSIYWQGSSYNDRGQCTEQFYGNFLVVRKRFNEETGFIEEIQSSNIQRSVQHLQIEYDLIGNVTSRSDENIGLVEAFEYDDINRLVSATVGDKSVTVTYDAIGNITSKSDVGDYTYGSNGGGPHAVSTISTANCPSFLVEEIDYYSFQKVRELKKDSVQLQYEYGPDRARYRSTIFINDTVSQTKTYIGKIYERIEEGENVREQNYIHTPEGVVAIETYINEENTDTRYIHKDHIGSVQTVTDENGSTLEVRSFDAWGKPRNPETWESVDANPQALFARGFTMHEFMSFFTLVNMNGRIYDPVIGRFISADPFIDGATDLQGYNRYSYVRNNPLTLVDPSGYFFKRIFRSVRKVVRKVSNVVRSVGRTVKKAVKAVGSFINKHKVTIAAVGIGILTGGIGAAIGGAIGGSVLGVSAGVIGSGFGAGFGSATAASLLNGASLGDALKAGVTNGLVGAVTAGLLAKVNQFKPSWGETFGSPLQKRVYNQLGRMGQRALVNGAAAKVRGGEFKSGALMSFASDAVRWGRDAYVENRVVNSAHMRDFRKKTYSTWETPPNDGIEKQEGQILVDPSKYSNVGTHGPASDWKSERSGFMSFIGKNIPGMNSMSVFHDNVAFDIPEALNIPTIPPAMVIEYYGLLGADPVSYMGPVNNKYFGFN